MITGCTFMIFDQLELYNKIFSNFVFGISIPFEEQIMKFLLRFPASILLLSFIFGYVCFSPYPSSCNYQQVLLAS